jgi:hypothetical protein
MVRAILASPGGATLNRAPDSLFHNTGGALRVSW